MEEKKAKPHKRLTIAELRNCKGFENISEEEAMETIKSLETISILFYELYMQQKRKEENLKQLKITKNKTDEGRKS
jgi:hypothetical protein